MNKQNEKQELLNNFSNSNYPSEIEDYDRENYLENRIYMWRY